MGIPNHVCSKLSDLDLQIIGAVPPGGNWKNIPCSVPSRRLEQIRASYQKGLGSRSTYYGRLLPDKPSYTINTYFNRPGNGCHIHFAQDRVLSAREAARLQSFPDSFEFSGTQSAINKQIGNAVPPLLAYQVAVCLGERGIYIDLFSGAGGLSLGFKWAGWTPIVANDIERYFLQTYANNIHDSVVAGSITDSTTFDHLIRVAIEAREAEPDMPFWILGGPPCQGFSTAGNRRSMSDERNLLFYQYRDFLDSVQPDGFIFENVPGLLNMEGGRVFSLVKETFGSVMPSVQGWLLSTDEYAIPQRRKRVFLIGSAEIDRIFEPPIRHTTCSTDPSLFDSLHPAISVNEALSDLPPLAPGQDGSGLNYVSNPQNTYQAFMRGIIGPVEYLESISSGKRNL